MDGFPPLGPLRQQLRGGKLSFSIWQSGIFTGASSGNNAIAYIGSTPIPAPFVYNYDLGASPTITTNKYAAGVNVFYIANTVHDFTV
jgi:hypothetical protein